MKILTGPESIQGSPEWKKWRSSKITATEASIILGESPFEDAKTLWKRKLGLIPEKEQTEAMRIGSAKEPLIRVIANQQTGLNYLPVVVESTQYPWMGASLDGLDIESNSILEIKCGVSAYASAEAKTCPWYYQWQIQWQLAVTGCDICHYYVGHPEKETVLSMVIERDQQRIDWAINKAYIFYEEYINFEEPE